MKVPGVLQATSEIAIWSHAEEVEEAAAAIVEAAEDEAAAEAAVPGGMHPSGSVAVLPDMSANLKAKVTVSEEQQSDPELMAKVYDDMADRFATHGLNLPAVEAMAQYFSLDDAGNPVPLDYREFPVPLPPAAVRLGVIFFQEVNAALAELVYEAAQEVMGELPPGTKPHTLRPDPFDVVHGGLAVGAPPAVQAARAAPSEATLAREIASWRAAAAATAAPRFTVHRLLLADSGTLLLCSIDHTGHLAQLRRRLRTFFPGGPSKQSTIIHASIARLVSPTPLPREAIARVQAACDRWSARLKGMRFDPPGAHFCCPARLGLSVLYHIRERQFTTVEGPRIALPFQGYAVPAAVAAAEQRGVEAEAALGALAQPPAAAVVAGGRLQLRLVPLDDRVVRIMQAAGYNPNLEILCRMSKSLASVLHHLGAKWQAAAPPAGAGAGGGQATAGAGAALYVHPPPSCPIGLRGMRWGGPDCDEQLKLLYSWGEAAAAAIPAAAAARAGATQLQCPASAPTAAPAQQQQAGPQRQQPAGPLHVRGRNVQPSPAGWLRRRLSVPPRGGVTPEDHLAAMKLASMRLSLARDERRLVAERSAAWPRRPPREEDCLRLDPSGLGPAVPGAAAGAAAARALATYRAELEVTVHDALLASPARGGSLRFTPSQAALLERVEAWLAPLAELRLITSQRLGRGRAVLLVVHKNREALFLEPAAAYQAACTALAALQPRARTADAALARLADRAENKAAVAAAAAAAAASPGPPTASPAPRMPLRPIESSPTSGAPELPPAKRKMAAGGKENFEPGRLAKDRRRPLGALLPKQ
eukprot:scaffold7.g3675.t1